MTSSQMANEANKVAPKEFTAESFCEYAAHTVSKFADAPHGDSIKVEDRVSSIFHKQS